MHTPWGPSQHVEHLPHGILSICTASHGGYYVPPETRAKMPKAALKTWAGPGWYEEDCDWALVALAFPEIVPEKRREEVLGYAREMVSNYHTADICAAFGLPHTPRR